jgi:hypothetical protein
MKSSATCHRLISLFPVRRFLQPKMPMNALIQRPALLGLCLFLLCGLSILAAEPAFRFEGGLLDGGLPANGTYDMTFELFDADVDGTSAGVRGERDGSR